MDNLQLRVLHSLIFNGPFLSDIGLFNGKMGVAITFAHLYLKSANTLYYDIMEELLEDILHSIYEDITYDFASGVAGIGWGVEYLRSKKMVESDSLSLYENINQKIMEMDIRRFKDISLETGLEGMLHYIMFLLSTLDRSYSPFDALFLSDLYDKVLTLLSTYDMNVQLDWLLHMYKNWYEGMSVHYNPNPAIFVQLKSIDEKLFYNYQLGIRNGISGWLLDNYIK